MWRCLGSLCLVLVCIAVLTSWGCGIFGGPSRVEAPGISASGAGSGAMDKYDTDGDGVVKGEELDKAPSLKAALAKLDANSDGGVSADEVADRVKQWQETRVGLMSLGCTVMMNGRGLAGVTVNYVPEEFLGSDVKPATGTTDDNGVAILSIQDSELSGVACGLYRVELSKKDGGTETLPPKFNTETVLGQEVALDAEGIQEGIRYDLGM